LVVQIRKNTAMGLWDTIVYAWNSMCAFFASFLGVGTVTPPNNLPEEAEPLVVTHGGDEEGSGTAPEEQNTAATNEDDDSDTSEISSGSENPDEISNEDIDLGDDDDDDSDEEEGAAKPQTSAAASDDKFSQYAAGRVRSGAFYDGSRPKINGGNIVKPELPHPSVSHLLPKITGDDAKEETGNMRSSKRFTVGFADTIGRRSGMEDAHSALGCFNGVDTQDAFMIFDGHNGPCAALAANERMPKVLQEELASCETPEEALKSSFHKIHDVIINEGIKGGCTATVVLFLGDKGYVAHVGDTRLALIREGMLRRLTIDHRPSNKAEADAVRARGGLVLCFGGREMRVNGMIAITRALGDRELGEALTCEPDVSPVPMEFGSDDVLILACDGLWDQVPDELVLNTVRNESDPQKAAEALRNLAYNRGSSDNISVMVIRSDK